MQQNPHGQIQIYVKYVKVFYPWTSTYLVSFNQLINIRLFEECGVADHIMMDLTTLSQVVNIASTHTDVLGELFCGEPYLFDRLYRNFLARHRLNLLMQTLLLKDMPSDLYNPVWIAKLQHRHHSHQKR